MFSEKLIYTEKINFGIIFISKAMRSAYKKTETEQENEIMKRKNAMLLAAAMLTTTVLSQGVFAAEDPANDPYGKYDETVTYTTGYVLTNQGADVLAGTPYENDTAENNAYTRYLKEVLNIQNENMFEATMGSDYQQKMSLAIAGQDIPDIMFVDDYKTLVELAENEMIEDLTDVYNNLACDTVRAAYESYDEQNNPLNAVTFDGKIMAIPKTQLSDGQDFLWVRKDWLDKLGLEEPKTMDEVADMLRAFVNDDPDGNGEDDTVGLISNSEVYGDYPNNMFAITNIFTAFGAYPDTWINGADGSVVYGSVQPEMKAALELLSSWYAEGLLDQQFTTRTYDDNVALLSSGKCGAFIGPWWAPFNTGLTSSYATDDAEWVNVSAPVGENGVINGINTKSYAGFVVVRKGYEHPEIAMKIVNVNSEYYKQDTSDQVNEILENIPLAYFNWPLYCEVQPGNNAEVMTKNVLAAMEDEAQVEALNSEEKGYYESAVRFLEAEEAGNKADSVDYSQYMSRVMAMSRMIENPADFVTPAFYETTDSMSIRWASLEKIEMQAILKIIIGEESIDSFDKFVSDWTKAGGELITEEVNEAVQQ